jgi:hypothetical protein
VLHFTSDPGAVLTGTRRFGAGADHRREVAVQLHLKRPERKLRRREREMRKSPGKAPCADLDSTTGSVRRSSTRGKCRAGKRRASAAQTGRTGTEQAVGLVQRQFQWWKGFVAFEPGNHRWNWMRLRGRREGCAIVRLEGDDVVDVEADADFFANRVVVVRWNQREHFDAAGQPQGVENFGAAKGLVPDFRQQFGCDRRG